MLKGVRVHGTTAVDADVRLDETFRSVPVPQLLGVPLLWKKLSGTGGDDSGILSNVIVKMMADPDSGLAPMDWQYGGAIGPAPPVLLVRKDKVPFLAEDFWAICSYIEHWVDSFDGEGETDAGLRNLLQVDAFREYLIDEKAEGRVASTALLSSHYPLGSVVEINGLAASELNGLQGEVAQFSSDRVGVRVAGGAVKAIKPERLRLISVKKDEPKQQHAGNSLEAAAAKNARQQELHRREAMQIVERFVSAIYEDKFPEADDGMLFGLGGEYRQRAQDVLGVWQDSIKRGELTQAEVGAALAEGRVKELFEETCKQLAKKRSSAYAITLVENKFGGVVWESL